MKRNLKLFTLPVIIVFLLIVQSICVFAGQGTYVFNRNMDVSMEDFNDVVFGKGLYIAVGNKGTVKYSSDGIKWNSCRTNWF